MIPKMIQHTQHFTETDLGKKKVNYTTLKTIIERSGAEPVFTNKLLLDIERHIVTRNKKRVHVRGSSEFPQLILTFKNHYAQKYSQTSLKHHIYHVGKFIGFVQRQFFGVAPLHSILDCKKFTKSMVVSYEEHLIERMHLDQIKKSTLNRMLFSMKLFLDMLSTLKVNYIRYIIPQSLRAQANRSNEFVNLEEVHVLLESIEKSSSNSKIRNMCIVLLIMELGCRPIEVANIHLDDLRLTERLITLHSVKSKTRTLKMSKDLTDMIHEYLHFTRFLYPVEHNNLFVTRRTRSPITSQMISSMFNHSNKISFGTIRFSAKSLRHTYATNALDNLNDFDQVSEAMGHKHRRSTEWYIHRSVQRLLANSLPRNPLNRMNEV
ncbi:tyrosine-type recombinase/integrase [Paenibacillus sp. FSL K6-2859]|uniref:tyrosine-type recombinase/integrase n=1 Tax=Paenibacillus sp. FSL K6-2859 TaxID=2921482 RepID=UPI0030FCADA4